jgi:hypothetical protein
MKGYGWRAILAGAIALAGLAIGWGVLAAGPRLAAAAVPILGTPAPPRRALQADPSVQATTIDSPSPTCYRPVAGTGSCYIQWNYIFVVASSPQYVISTTVSIDGRLSAYHGGFFQTSMYVPGQLYGPGFRVQCGLPAGDGHTDLGNTYSYTIRARETGGNVATNSGSVQCPADVVRVFLPITRRR